MLSSTVTVAQLKITGGTVTITNGANLLVDGNVIHETGNINNKGALVVKGNWVNNSTQPVFNDESTGNVLFSGADQNISGLSTVFPSIELAGTGTKTIEVNTSIKEVLKLNDRELKLEGRELTVLNNNANAIEVNGGYISTNLPDGKLLRHTNSTDSYLFPMGSAIGTARVRPVAVNPKDNNNNVYSISFHNNDATADGYSVSQKRDDVVNINTKFYHVIAHPSGTSGANFILQYSSTEDGVFNQLVNWEKSVVGWEKAGISNPQTSAGLLPSLNSNFTFSSAQSFNKIPVAFASSLTENEPLTFFNGFSPNGDGKNDRWEIKNIDVFPDNELTILNRWGGEVFRAKPYNSFNAWDGSGLANGTYYYLLKVNINGTPKVYKGFITLMKNE